MRMRGSMRYMGLQEEAGGSVTGYRAVVRLLEYVPALQVPHHRQRPGHAGLRRYRSREPMAGPAGRGQRGHLAKQLRPSDGGRADGGKRPAGLCHELPAPLSPCPG